MKYNIGWCALVAIVALAGCATPENHSQLHVIGRPALRGLRMPVTAEDRAAVKSIVQNLAVQLKAVDRTTNSFNSNIIASFAQEDRAEPFTVEAYAYEDFIVVDLRHQPTSMGETRQYRHVQELLYSALQEKFGKRLLMPAQISQVRNIPQPTTPPPAQ